jgi:hypothetical protein
MEKYTSTMVRKKSMTYFSGMPRITTCGAKAGWCGAATHWAVIGWCTGWARHSTTPPTRCEWRRWTGSRAGPSSRTGSARSPGISSSAFQGEPSYSKGVGPSTTLAWPGWKQPDISVNVLTARLATAGSRKAV